MFNANQPRIDAMRAWREIAPAVRAAVADRYPVQKQLAGKMGVTRAALSAWLLGTHTPLFDSAMRLVDEAGLSWATLMGETASSPVAIGSESIFPIRCEAVNVSAGPGAPWTEYPTKDDRDRHYFYRRSFVRAALNIPEDAPDPPLDRFATVLLDRDSKYARSMVPTIRPGSMLLVDKEIDRRNLPARAICFVNMAKEWKKVRLVAVKRVTVIDHHVILESDNPEPEEYRGRKARDRAYRAYEAEIAVLMLGP